MDLKRILANDISSRDNPSLKKFLSVDNYQEVSCHAKKLKSLQFRCNIYVRLRSALDSRASGGGFDARLDHKLFLDVIKLSATMQDWAE